MLEFKVPIEKPENYPNIAFNELSNFLLLFVNDYGKWPDQIEFYGKTGKELYNIITQKFDLTNKFILNTHDSILNKIIIKYSKKLDMVDSHSTPFKIEKKIDPKLEITLIR